MLLKNIFHNFFYNIFLEKDYPPYTSKRYFIPLDASTLVLKAISELHIPRRGNEINEFKENWKVDWDHYQTLGAVQQHSDRNRTKKEDQ